MDHAKHAHPTKKGPGRYHAAVKHGRAPLPSTGHHFGQHTNAKRKAQRAITALIGHRQFKRRAMAALREARDAARGAA